MARSISFALDSVVLIGDIDLPKRAVGLVLFAHGSGSSRLSPRNRQVAEELNRQGMGTLLFDLLTEEEDEVYQTRFNIALLTERLVQTTAWVAKQKDLARLSLGYFGASTGAAAALMAAAELDGKIKAVVSRGGRPDLAGDVLPRVKSPTLLIVGGADEEVIVLNQEAFDQMTCLKKIEIVPGATHLFEEPGAIEQVQKLAAAWFKKYLK